MPFRKCVERTGRTIKAVGERIESAGRDDRDQDRLNERQPHPSAAVTRDESSFGRIASISRVSDIRRAQTGPIEEKADTAPLLLGDHLESIEEGSG